MNITTKKNKLFQLALLLQGLTSFFALAVYAYLGTFTRYLADDYYHSSLLQNGESLWQISVEKYLYVSNRYTTMSYFFFGEKIGIQWISALMILLWLLGLIWFFYELQKTLPIPLSRWMPFSIASVLIFLSILEAPNRFQSIYWLSGSQSYFAPLVFLSYFFTMLLRFSRFPRHKKTFTFALLFSLIVAFLIGGLSETVGALHIGILSFTILATFIWGEKDYRKNVLMLFGAALIGALISLVVMAFSPANAIRSSAAPIAISVFLQRLVFFPFAFILDTFKTLPIPNFFTVFLAFLIFSEDTTQKKKNLYWALALTPIIMYALIALSFAPSAYALSYPDARVRFPARFVMVCALFIEGALVGVLFRAKEKFWVMLLLVGTVLYPLRGAWQACQSLPKYRAYATAWDTRDSFILSQKEDGMMEIAVPPMDGMAGIKELDVDPKHWVNQAAAAYYGVDAISVHSSDLSYDE